MNFKKLMKTSSIVCAIGVISLSLTSCNLDDPENVNTYTFEVLNLITSENSETQPLLTTGKYTFRLDGNKNLMRVETSDLLYNNVNHSFTTKDFRYSPQGFMTEFQTGSYISFNAGSDNVSDGSTTVTNLKGALNSTCYPPGQLQSTPVFSYNIGNDLKVRTLAYNSFFIGETTLKQTGSPEVTTSDGIYQLVINNSEMTATLAISALPLRNLDSKVLIVLKNLPIALSDTGYAIEKDEVTAEVSNNPGDHSWIFKDVSIRTTDESLTRTQIKLTLADETEVNLTANVQYTLF